MADRTPTILVVEDNPGDRRLVIEGIDRVDPSITVVAHGRGTDAIGWLTDEAADPTTALVLVLLDLNLPGSDGHEVLRVLRDHEVFADVAVAVVSSSEDPRDVDRVYARGANGYLTKPNDPDTYIDMIARAVGFWTP